MKALFLAALLASTCQLGPFNDPPPVPDQSDPIVFDPPLAAAGASSSCSAAIENSKRLGCVFAADDPLAWCKTLPVKQVTCINAAQNCLATRTCTEPAK